MDTLSDMALFVQVVNHNALAAAGRELGLSPASMSARIKRLEKHHGVKLLHRTTRRITLTDEGRGFYADCVNILAEVKLAEDRLQSKRQSFSGPLRITASTDLGQCHIASVLTAFIAKHPEIKPCLHLTDGVVNIIEQGFDLAVRIGFLADNRLVARKLANNYRVLCAAPDYLEKYGTPQRPEDLIHHHCLALIRDTEPLTNWHLKKGGPIKTIPIQASRSTNNGALLRRWALQGAGIALKSIWDIAEDLQSKDLVTVLGGYEFDITRQSNPDESGLYAVYPSREYLPLRIRAFIDALNDHFANYKLPDQVHTGIQASTVDSTP